MTSPGARRAIGGILAMPFRLQLFTVHCRFAARCSAAEKTAPGAGAHVNADLLLTHQSRVTFDPPLGLDT